MTERLDLLNAGGSVAAALVDDATWSKSMAAIQTEASAQGFGLQARAATTSDTSAGLQSFSNVADVKAWIDAQGQTLRGGTTQTVVTAQKLTPLAVAGLVIGAIIGAGSELQSGSNAGKVALGAGIGALTGTSLAILLGDLVATSRS